MKRLPSSLPLRAERELFLISFIALFLEMMLIRWAPSVYRLIAYYANLMLISSFLGLGLGAMTTRKLPRLDALFAPILFSLVLFLWLSRQVLLPGNSLELRYFVGGSQLTGYAALILTFLLNVSSFMPLGQRIGRLFDRLPPLRAYRWDLCGSLAGTLCFALFSYAYFSPVIGLAGVLVLYLWSTPIPRDRVIGLIFSGAILMIVAQTGPGVRWSPYYHITLFDEADPLQKLVTTPPPDLKTMKNPPLYTVRVNQDFYQTHGSLNPRRYDPLPAHIVDVHSLYSLPYHLVSKPEDVLVAGAGGGIDVEQALLSGARWIDAVEIDPVLIRLARRFNAGDPYADPRVHIHEDDVRAFFQKTSHRYDLVTFGYLDSQALSSSMANVRLDGFVYTVESFRSAYQVLKDNGILCVSFNAYGKTWLLYKLFSMLREATGQEPLVYLRNMPQVIFCVPRHPLIAPPIIESYHQVTLKPPAVNLATDDWPYLYLSRKGLPLDYLVVIGILTVLSLGVLLYFRDRGASAQPYHFLFLGMGFMLLEMKSIIDASLYLGSTWRVILLVVLGILGMVLLANELAVRTSGFKTVFYVPLFLSLIGLVGFPHAWILSWPLAGRLVWTLFAVPLPILFSGLIFSASFRQVENPSAVLGANLMGATLGGFLEYLGMSMGYHQLSLLVITVYLASLLSLLRIKNSDL